MTNKQLEVLRDEVSKSAQEDGTVEGASLLYLAAIVEAVIEIAKRLPEPSK